jgi:hypothetical protein
MCYTTTASQDVSGALCGFCGRLLILMPRDLAELAGAKRRRPQPEFKDAPALFDEGTHRASQKSLKNRIRGLQRLLNTDLPKAARKDKVRLLRKLEKEVRTEEVPAPLND